MNWFTGKELSNFDSVIIKMSILPLIISFRDSNLFRREFIFSWPIISWFMLESLRLFKISKGSSCSLISSSKLFKEFKTHEELSFMEGISLMWELLCIDPAWEKGAHMQVYKHKDKTKQKYLKYENSCMFSPYSHEIQFTELFLLHLEMEKWFCWVVCSLLRIMWFVSPVILQYPKLLGALKCLAIGDALSILVKKLELLLCVSL